MNLKKEIEILKKVSHKNIVKYFYTDICEDNSSVDIVFEYVPGGSISSMLSKFGKFDEKLIWIGRDIKGHSILIDSDSTIKLSGFGAANLFINEFGQFEEAKEELNHVARKSLEGPHWMAPEVALNIGPGFPADIWSVGCVVIEMLTGKPPYSNCTKQPKEILKMISTGKTPMYPLSISQNCKDFLDSCLKYKPDERKKANPSSNIPQNNEVSKNNTSNLNDPKNHSSQFLSNSDILLSFFVKSRKQLASSPPKGTAQAFDKESEPYFVFDEKSKRLQKTKSNVSEGIAEHKKEEELEEEKEMKEKMEKLRKQRMLEEKLRKDTERRKLQKNSANQNNNKLKISGF